MRSRLARFTERKEHALDTLRIQDLHYRSWGPVDLDIAPAECVCLSGPSGSGKTLLLRAIADLDPHEGSIVLGDLECRETAAPNWRRRVGLLPAESQWWDERVGDHFPSVDEDRLTHLGFDLDVLGWSVSRLSTGEKQRLALARLLSNDPSALLLDEPTASLDPDNVSRAEAMIASYRREAGAPVLWVSHDPAQITRVADRAYRMHNGALTRQE